MEEALRFYEQAAMILSKLEQHEFKLNNKKNLTLERKPTVEDSAIEEKLSKVSLKLDKVYLKLINIYLDIN